MTAAASSITPMVMMTMKTMKTTMWLMLSLLLELHSVGAVDLTMRRRRKMTARPLDADHSRVSPAASAPRGSSSITISREACYPGRVILYGCNDGISEPSMQRGNGRTLVGDEIRSQGLGLGLQACKVPLEVGGIESEVPTE